MRVYHLGLHEYATVIRMNEYNWLVQYDGSEQVWAVDPQWLQEVELEDA